jgi:hypothetical protein
MEKARKKRRKGVKATRKRESIFTIPNGESKKIKHICDIRKVGRTSKWNAIVPLKEPERKRKDCRKEKEA